jgi:predicted DNA-binding protein YlxM (UPF0122 family)
MALADKRDEAERLYVRESMSCDAIAKQLGIDKGTVYRWKAEAKEKNVALDWETKRRICNMSVKELLGIYAEGIKTWMLKFKETPELFADSKAADALIKHISALQKIDPRSQYLGVAIDLIKTTNEWLAENEPELKTKMEPHWDEIYEALNKDLTRKGIY